ncbi:hypothetical protein ACJX0J_034828, partial [Zea mays]
ITVIVSFLFVAVSLHNTQRDAKKKIIKRSQLENQFNMIIFIHVLVEHTRYTHTLTQQHTQNSFFPYKEDRYIVKTLNKIFFALLS